jgi:ankyrin repeat protein
MRDHEKVKFFIECGADPGVADSENVTPLHVALMQGEFIDEIIARMLLRARPTTPISEILQVGKSVDQLFLDHSENPDNANTLRFLLELGADVNVLNSERETPLMRAVRFGDLKVIKILLEQETVDLYTRDRYGYTALHIATIDSQLGALNLLLSSERLDVNCPDRCGNSAFWLSVELGRDSVSERFLKDSRLDVNARGGYAPRWKTTALYNACSRENIRIVSSILAATHVPRVDPNVKGDRRTSPLGIAAYQGAYDLAKMLLSADGIWINAVDEEEDDPLWLALQRHELSVVDLFLDDSRLDINCQNNRLGDTYLIAAAREGFVSLVKRLLGIRGARLDARNKKNESALGVAYQLHHRRIIQILVDGGAVN